MEALLFDWPISSPSSWVISNETTSEGDWNLNFFFVGSELFLRVASRFWWIMINCCDWSCCEYVIHPSRVLVYKTTRCFGLRSSREEEVEDQQKVKPEKTSLERTWRFRSPTHGNWKVRIGSASFDATTVSQQSKTSFRIKASAY